MSAALRPNILYLVHRFPYPPDKGDRIRAFHILKWLSSRANVHLACLADEPASEGSISELRRYCGRVAVEYLGARTRGVRASWSLALGGTATCGVFRSGRLGTIIRQWAGETSYQAVLASSSGMIPYLRRWGLHEVPAVIDLVDVDSQKWLDYSEAAWPPKSWVYRVEGRRLRGLERSSMSWARAVTLVSEDEAALFRRACGDGPVHAVTNGVDLEYFRHMAQVERYACVFLGALDYAPNVDGIAWFCREVWPAILHRLPGATVALVGRSPSAAVRRLGELPGVDLVGPVADVRPYLSAGSVAIAPLRIARGVQNKVLEAMAMGRAVMATPQALTGLAVKPGVHALAASSAADWIESLALLLGDESLRRTLGLAARGYVEAGHDWETCLGAFGPLLGIDVTPGHSGLASLDVALSMNGR